MPGRQWWPSSRAGAKSKNVTVSGHYRRKNSFSCRNSSARSPDNPENLLMANSPELPMGGISCPACGACFTPKRKDQTYCSDRCRKNNYSRKDRARSPHNSIFSPTKWRENMEIFDRNRRLVELVCKERSSEARDKVTLSVISAAEGGHGQLRTILTNKIFLFPDRENELLFCPGCEHLGTIAQIVNRYSFANWGCSICDALSTNTKEEIHA